MKIVIDWDSVILNTSTSLINNWNLLNPNKQLKIINPNEVEWDFSNVLKDTDISLKELFTIFDYKNFYDNAYFLNGAIDIIQELINKGHKIVICSKHDSDRRPITARFINKIFEGKVKIKYVNSFETKREVKCNILIDDKEESLINCKAKLPILFGNYKWNKDSKLHYRATSWNQIREVFKFANIL